MKICVESTSRQILVNDVPARIWQGYSEQGVELAVCVLYLTPAIASKITPDFKAAFHDHIEPLPVAMKLPDQVLL
jgi:hypothetical protein